MWKPPPWARGFDAPTKTQYVGNISAGSSGSVGFALTPNEAGKLKLVLKVTYEDPNLQPQTKEFPVELTVSEAPDLDFDPDLDAGRGGKASPSPGRCCWSSLPGCSLPAWCWRCAKSGPPPRNSPPRLPAGKTGTAHFPMIPMTRRCKG